MLYQIFQMLLDGTFCQACLVAKVNIKDQLPKYLGDVKLLTTKCCIQEVEKLGPELFGAAVILKQVWATMIFFCWLFTSRFSGMVMGWVGMLFLLLFLGRLAFGPTF